MSFAPRVGTASSAGSGGSTRRPTVNPAAAVGRHNHVARLALARGGPGGDAPTSTRSEGGAGKGSRPPALRAPPSRGGLGTPTPYGSSPRVLTVHGADSLTCEVPAVHASGKDKCICELCTCGYVQDLPQPAEKRVSTEPANTRPPFSIHLLAWLVACA